MERYRDLAKELISVLDQKHKGPPHEEVSAAMRGEMAVLCLLIKQGSSLTAGEISRQLNMTTSRVAAVLNSLQKKDMIVRSTDAADKRRVQVTLTKEGRVLCETRREQVIESMTQLLCGLGEEDAANFVRIITKIQTMMPEPQCLCGEQSGREEDHPARGQKEEEDER